MKRMRVFYFYLGSIAGKACDMRGDQCEKSF